MPAVLPRPGHVLGLILSAALVATTLQVGQATAAESRTAPAIQVRSVASVAEPEPTDPQSRAKASGKRVEDRTKWDATSRTYANPDGTWTTTVSPSTINFRGGDEGGWQPIDTTLTPTSRAGFAAENADGPGTLLLPADAGRSPVRLEDRRGGWVSFRLHEASGAARVGERSATVADGPGDASVRYDSIPTGVKESITLPAAPAGPLGYTFDLNASPGLTPVLSPNNEILFNDGDARVRFRMPAPFMFDSSESIATSSAVAVQLQRSGSGWRLTLTPDHAWLNDPARVYPVVVDPTTEFVEEPSKDTYLAEDTPATVLGTQTTLRVGRLAASGTRRRALVQFAMPSSVPTRATVSDAEFRLWVLGSTNSTPLDVAVRQMNTGWTQASAKWSGSGTGTTWDGATGFFTQATAPNQVLNGTTGRNGWDVKAIVSRWVATPTDNFGFMVKAQADSVVNEIRFAANESTFDSQDPELSFTWSTAPPTITANSLTVSPSLPTADGPVARSLTPTLTASAVDADSDIVRYQFDVLDSSGAVVATSGAATKTNTPGTPLNYSHSIAAGQLVEGQSYTAKFYAWDESTSKSFGPSVQLPFRVDQTPTAPTQLAVDPVSATTPLLTTPVVDPELSAIVTDPGSTGTVTARFELREVLAGGGFGPVVDLGADDVDSGGRAAVTVPPEGPDSLTPGKTYEFRVGAQDGVDQAQTPPATTWSASWAKFRVDTGAQVSVPLQLAEPLTVWHNGPDISWTPYRDPSSAPGDDLKKYQIFRGCRTLPSGGCTNPVEDYQQADTAGLEEIAVLEPGQTDFHDRTAIPSSPTEAATYRYWVVAQTVDEEQLNKNGALASNGRDVTTPRQGRVRRILNQGVADGTISKKRPTVANADVLQAGNDVHATDGVQRALLDFDVSVINPGMRVTSASIQVRKINTGTTGAFALHEITGKDFVEGQATWSQAATNDPWGTAGGDLGSPALGQVTTASSPGAVTYADSAAMRSVVQKWVNDKAANHGVAIRAVDEAAGAQRWLDMVPAQSTQLDPTTLTETRPRLVVEHMTTSTLDTFSAPDLPQRYIPNTNVTVPVTVTNTTETDWDPGLQLSYRWTKVADQTTTNGTQKADLFPGSNTTRGLKSGESVTVQLIVAPPINSDTGNSRETKYHLQLDLRSAGAWWKPTTDGGQYYRESDLSAAQLAARQELLDDNICAMMPDGLMCPRRVIEAPSSTELGLEKFASYATEATGAGSALLANLNTGNLTWSYDAMSNPSVGPSFFARVSYNSKDVGTNTGMGFGWSVQPGTLSRLNAPLVLSGSDYKAVKLTDGDGTEHGWSNPTTVGTVTTYDRPAGIHLDLTKDTSKPDEEFYRFTRPDGTAFYYHRISRLPTKVRDISGNTLTYQPRQPGVDDRLDRITDAKGRIVATVGYSGEKVSWIRDISGRTLTFVYNAGNPNFLDKIQDGTGAEAKEFTFNYANYQANVHSVLTKVTDPRTSATTIGYYEGTNDKYPSTPGETVPPWVMGKVRSWTDRSGQTTEVEYYDSLKLPSGTTMPAGAARYSRVFDRGLSTPEMTTYGIDAYGRTIELKDANATTPGAPADRADDVTRLGWDADHNVVRQELPNGAISRWQFDPKTGFPKRTWDPEAVRTGGKPTVMTYHPPTANGAVTLKSVTSPLGHTSEFGIDTAGRLTSVKDPEGGLTGYTYNPADGTMATATDPLGNKTTYAYPAAALNVGYPSVITPPTTTKAPGDDAADAPTSFSYDERGNVEKTTTTATVGGVTRTLETTADYDTFGRPKFVTSPGAQGGNRTTRYTYDLNDNQLTVEAPNGALTTNTYFPDDQAKTTTLPDNGSGTRMVAFGYDALGRLCREIAPKAGATSASCPASSSTVPPAYATDYRYDHVGQVTSTTGSDAEGKAVVTSYNYDNVGNVIGVRDPKMNRAGSTSWTTEAVYDLAGRQTTLIDALGYSTRTVYDADSNVVRTIDQAGKVRKFTYDKAGRSKTTTVTYNGPSGPAQEWTTTRCYDAAGNLVKTIRPRSTVRDCAATTGLFTQTKYDENNRPFQTLSAFDAGDPDAVYQKPASTFLKYDALGRMSAQSQPTSSDTAPAMSAVKEWTRFTHFDSGEIATSVDPTGISTAYEYDLIGKQTKRTLTGANADGTPSTATRTMTWVYNKDGSLQSRVDATTEATALVADNSDGETARAGTWTTVKPTGGTQHGVDYLAHTAGSSDHVTWKVTPADSGKYRIEFKCPQPDLDAGEPAGPRTSSASYALSAGSTTFTRTGDQTGCSGGWRALGDPVDLDAGTPATLKLTPGGSGVTVADAVRLVATDAKRQYSYTYDRNGQQEQVIDERPGGRVSKFVTTYDVLGRVGSVKEYGTVNPLVAMRQTLYSYDPNSNLTKVEASRMPENSAVDGRGSLGASSTTTYTWDARNLVDTVTQQIGSGTARTWDYQWNSRGLLESLTKPNAAGTAGAGNVVSYRYFDNGLLRDKTERKPGTGGDGFVTSSHALTYNPDGDPVRDITKVQRHNATSSWRAQTIKYSYTPTQALRSVDKTGEKSGDDEKYQYDIAGNTIKSTIGKTTTCNTYDAVASCDEPLSGGVRLTSAKVTTNGVSATSTYAYDDFGRLTSVTNPTVPGARASYSYDGFDRVVAETHGELSKTTAYDPFDRVTVQNVTKAGVSKKTRYSYLGTSEQVAAEERWDGGSSTWKQVKAYGYGPDGKPLVMQSTPVTGAAKTRYYSSNTHGDTEALTDPGTGDVTAAYRYTAYGAPDVNDNAGEDTVAQKDDTANPADPTKDALNPYRYSSKRIDAATGDYDMGFRNYDPGLNRFTTRDMYNGALADLALGADPWNTNRYAFAGGNPITRIEYDGHRAVDINGNEYNPQDPGLPSGHNVVLADSRSRALAQASAEAEFNDGDSIYATMDFGSGGRGKNTIPGAHRHGTGAPGVADLILWTDTNIYVWEIKSSKANRFAAYQQLQRYVNKLQEVEDKKENPREVEVGWDLGDTPYMESRDGWVRGHDDRSSVLGLEAREEGLRWYSLIDDEIDDYNKQLEEDRKGSWKDLLKAPLISGPLSPIWMGPPIILPFSCGSTPCPDDSSDNFS